MSAENDLRGRLAHLPHPPMPPSVAAGITARLAQEDRSGEVVPLTSRHQRRLTWLVAAAAVAGLLMLVSLSTGPAPAPVAQPPVVRAGAVYDPAVFGQQLRERMQGPGGNAATRTFADSPQAISDCAKAIQAYGRVVALDAGTYGAADAVVLVTTFVPASGYEEVWVVDPGCGAQRAVVLHHMILDVDASTTAGRD